MDGEFEDLFEEAPCGYLGLDATGRIKRANATFARWIGASAPALVGRRFRDLLTTPSRIFYETHVAPMLRLEGGLEEAALDFATSDGTALPTLVNAVETRGAEGEVVGVRIVVFRAMARRGYERDLKTREAVATQSLQDERSVAELREQFIAVLGHDLRNPLAAIGGGLQRLRRDPQTERSTVVLKLMEQSVERMARLIDDVLDFARARLGDGVVVHRERRALEPVLRQVVSELESAEPARAIICDFDSPDPISFDAGRIAQLVSNLLANALVHGDASEPVRLETRTAEGLLELTVANAGDPISPAAMERLFQPFFRGEVRRSQQGLGLGLHIASEIAKAHAGRLQVTSDALATRFTLVMPLD